MARSTSSTAVSAPGKVLFTGGYLVLDRGYSGTVFSLDARIHVIVNQVRKEHRKSISSASGASQSDANPVPSVEKGHEEPAEYTEDEDTVIVRSPQFVNAVWEYSIDRCENKGGVRVVQKGEG